MIGSGPFMLVAAEQGESVELAANKDHYGAPPNVDGVIFQTIEADDARVTALTTGEIDAIAGVPGDRHPAAPEQRRTSRSTSPTSRPAAA